jgi:hypothetical protein
MGGALWQTVESSNSRMGELLAGAQGALRGECAFGPTEVRALGVVLGEMAPVIAKSQELRRTHPEIAEALNLYRSQLVNLQKTVERLRITLLVHRSTLEGHRTHLSAASLWCTAFQRTR